jgi:hypothetical protein
MSDGLTTESVLRALLEDRPVSRTRLEVAYADMLLIRAERDRYHDLLAEGLEPRPADVTVAGLGPRPADVTVAEWLEGWIERIREALV